MKRCFRKNTRGCEDGFTLTEVLVATAITSVVFSQIVVALVSSQRMYEATIADVELSLRSRALREKLLFNINEDGGLMNACQTELEVENPNKGKGNGLTFKPNKGSKNRIALNNKKKLKADNGKENWLTCGPLVFQGTNVFSVVATNGTIQADLNMAILIGKRTYGQQQLIQAQIMNE